jgi:hypothetical protein
VITRRRITLQLVPLLDLLFIVLFAQYIDLQGVTRGEVDAAAAQRQQAEAERLQADQLRTDALNRLEELNRRTEQWEIERRRLTRELELAREEGAKEGQAREEMERVAARDRQAIGALVKDVLNVSEGVVQDILRTAGPIERQRLQSSFEQMKVQSASGIVHHLRATEELKKRADLWEVYIGDDNALRVTLVDQVVAESLQVRGADQVANELAALARQQGEPKSLVIILLSWSDADRRTRNAVRDGLDRLVPVLKAEWPGKRIEVAPLGYTPEPP